MGMENRRGSMFECERCGSSYSATHIGVEHCPRCRLRDRVQAPLTFKVFRAPDPMAPPPGTAAGVPAPTSPPVDGSSAWGQIA
jgi:hypothetical protein